MTRVNINEEESWSCHEPSMTGWKFTKHGNPCLVFLQWEPKGLMNPRTNSFFAILPGSYWNSSIINYNMYEKGCIPHPNEGARYTGVLDINLIRLIVKDHPRRINTEWSLVELAPCQETDVGLLINALARMDCNVGFRVKVLGSLSLKDRAFITELEEERNRQEEIGQLKARLAQLGHVAASWRITA